MRILSNSLARGVCAAMLAAAGSIVAPGVASASLVTITVHEGQVADANAIDVTAQGLTAKYLENLTLTPLTANSGTFTANILTKFTAYTIGAGVPVTSQLAPQVAGEVPANQNLYSMYALVTATGTYDSFLVNSLTNRQVEFSLLGATANLFTDPNRDTTYTAGLTDLLTGADTDDKKILTASTVDLTPGVSGGEVTLSGNQNVLPAIPRSILGGRFNIVFTDPSLVSPFGPLYWDLGGVLVFQATSSGDIDPTSECLGNGCSFPGAIVGDSSISLQDVPAVPEPASLLLLGTGLIGAAAARRRKN